MTRRPGLVIVTVTVLAVGGAVGFAAAPAPAAFVLVQNVDGPPISVEAAGLPPVTVNCPGHQTISVPHRNLVPADLVIADARTGVVLREVLIWGDIELLVRGRNVLIGEANPGPSGPPSMTGCL